MKLLKICVKGMPHFKSDLNIDFTAVQRVEENHKESLYNLYSNIYLNNAISFIGINASGKTTILNVVAFVMTMLNNGPINLIKERTVMEDLPIGNTVTIETFFYYDQTLNKLQTNIEKVLDENGIDSKFVITSERLWSKQTKSLEIKKNLFEFNDTMLFNERNAEEAYLMDDVSIIVAINKKSGRGIPFKNMSMLTNFNLLSTMGNFPKELIAFLDPSIEYLNFDIDAEEFTIRLRFKEREDEIVLNNPAALNNYLSSGTIKGIGVFMDAIFAFKTGGYLIIDELENHFNKEIVATLIRFFLDYKVNKKGATLIFSTHYSELLDEFERSDNIYIVRNRNGITSENLSNILKKRNDIKKSDAYQSDFLEGTVPAYESYMRFKKVLMNN